MKRITIQKETTAVSLEEKITIFVESDELKKYVNLIKRTWPKTSIAYKDVKYG